jgi:glycosyltransferase involved in cell wall biosynthesis
MICKPTISVIICTRNRAAPLDRTLVSMEMMGPMPGIAWELIVVDNGSTDGTQKTLECHRRLLPLKAVYHGEKGLSRARNRGVEEASGNWIVWTDDDVRVDPHWLQAYAQSFKDYPEAVVFGGPIEPELEGPRRPWMQNNLDVLRHALAAREFGPFPVPLSLEDDRMPFGANFAVRAAEQSATLYDVNLGAGSGGSTVGEETALIRELLGGGSTGMWVPGARVRHIIPLERQSRSYVFDYYAGHGATDARRQGHWAKVPPWLLRRLVTRWADYSARRLVPGRTDWVKPLVRYAYDCGYLKGVLTMRREARHGSAKAVGVREAAGRVSG